MNLLIVQLPKYLLFVQLVSSNNEGQLTDLLCTGWLVRMPHSNGRKTKQQPIRARGSFISATEVDDDLDVDEVHDVVDLDDDF